MEEWAHEVRLDANEQRHADEKGLDEQDAPLPNWADADKSIAFAKALGEFMFVLPAKVRRGRNPPTT